PVSLLVAALLLAGGLALGWVLGKTTAGAGAEERAKAAERLRADLAAVTGGRDAASRALAALQADARNLDARPTALLAATEARTAQCHEVGAKLLSEAQRQFLERADARFNQAGEKSEAQLKALLQPVEATLKRYEEGLKEVEKSRVDQYAGL